MVWNKDVAARVNRSELAARNCEPKPDAACRSIARVSRYSESAAPNDATPATMQLMSRVSEPALRVRNTRVSTNDTDKQISEAVISLNFPKVGTELTRLLAKHG